MKPLDWAEIIHKEYIDTFIRHGGAAVKVAVTVDQACRNEVRNLLQDISRNEGFPFVPVDAVSTKIHLVDKLFHEVAKQVDWDELAFNFVKQTFADNGYIFPEPRDRFNLREIALLNGREEKFLRREVGTWLEQKIFHDFEMSQEFRIAMIRLCIACIDQGGENSFLANSVKEWLCGELRHISALKEALIFQKVTRYNARHLLFSLVHWLKINGRKGLVLMLDISRYGIGTKSVDPDSGFYYSVPATLDLYEVLRQFIDGTDEVQSCLIVVTASKDFLTDEKRGVNRYNALKLRVLDEVRDKNRQNPFSSLIRLSSDS